MRFTFNEMGAAMISEVTLNERAKDFDDLILAWAFSSTIIASTGNSAGVFIERVLATDLNRKDILKNLIVGKVQMNFAFYSDGSPSYIAYKITPVIQLLAEMFSKDSRHQLSSEIKSTKDSTAITYKNNDSHLIITYTKQFSEITFISNSETFQHWQDYIFKELKTDKYIMDAGINVTQNVKWDRIDGLTSKKRKAETTSEASTGNCVVQTCPA